MVFIVETVQVHINVYKKGTARSGRNSNLVELRFGLLCSFQKQVCSTCFVNQDIMSLSWCIFLINMGGEAISNMFNITHDYV